MRPIRFTRRALAWLAWLPLAVVGAPAFAAEPLELAVKAAYLAKFPFYVEWPASAFSALASPIVLCVVGDDPFGSLLDEAAAAQPVKGHPLVVRRLKAATRNSGCHIAYLSGDASADELRGSSTLVVTDAPDGGGIVNFVLKDNRVRFTVDDDAAARNGLTISSKLLSVALSVKPRGAR